MTLDDGLPQQICNICMTNLLNANAFRLNCERSQAVLEQLRNTWCSTSEPIEHESADIEDSISSPKSYSDFEFLNIEHVIGQEQLNEVKLVDDQPIAVDISVDSRVHCSDAHSDDDNDSNEGQNDVAIDSQFECGICGKAYKRQVHLTLSCTYNEEFTHPCVLFLQPHLLRHMNASHRETSDKSPAEPQSYAFECYKCDAQFAKSKALQRHANEMHSCHEQTDVICELCKTVFHTKAELEIHLVENHTKDRPYMCKICKKSFQSISNHNTHVQSHNKGIFWLRLQVDDCVQCFFFCSSENSYHCNVCGQGFKSKVYLNKHRKALHTVTKHDCPHCNLKFDNSVKFSYHLKSHDPNKKFKCKYCAKSFLQQHHLVNHERTHTGLRPYLCNHCGKGNIHTLTNNIGEKNRQTVKMLK